MKTLIFFFLFMASIISLGWSQIAVPGPIGVQSNSVTFKQTSTYKFQSNDNALTASMILGILAIVFLIIIILFALFCIPLQILAKKTSTPDAWLAWIPIGNLYLLCKIGQKPGWWMLLMLIPFVGIIFFVLVWMGVCYVRHRPTWLGLFILVPIVNCVLPWYLALSDEKNTP